MEKTRSRFSPEVYERAIGWLVSTVRITARNGKRPLRLPRRSAVWQRSCNVGATKLWENDRGSNAVRRGKSCFTTISNMRRRIGVHIEHHSQEGVLPSNRRQHSQRTLKPTTAVVDIRCIISAKRRQG